MYCTNCGSQFEADVPPSCPLCGTPSAAIAPPYATTLEYQHHQFTFHGDNATLFAITFRNWILTILTLGVYSFWGRAKVREYLYSQTEFMGDRFAYHGTGLELFVGFLKAIVLFGLVIAQLYIWPWVVSEETALIVSPILFYLGMFAFLPAARLGAWRYRMSRTSYRGIRFSFQGSMSDFYLLNLKCGLLVLVTFGFYMPYYLTRQRQFLVANTYYGSAKFDFDGTGGDLLGATIIAGALWFITLGLSLLWLSCKRQVYFWSRTTLPGSRLQTTLFPADLMWLTVINILALVLTLGLASAWTAIRTARRLTEGISVYGSLNYLDTVQQRAVAATATGEGLSTFLDTDIGFGL